MAEITLKGKRALVTGAASGIGRAIATKFAEAGAEVFVLDLNAEAAQKTAAEIATATGSTCHALSADVSDETSVAKAFAALPENKLDVLVNSAGIAHVGSIETTSADDFDRLYKVNVRGTFLVMQEAIKRMSAAKSGVILNLASIAATTGLDKRFAYGMTKGAVLAMTLSVAKDCLPYNIRCNCISPARVHTPFVDGFLAKNYPGRETEMMATLAAAQPIGRMGTPAEIGDLALYLCSDTASFITGVDWLIDGGFTNLR
ncbi:SDR family NAD(P)-dependent oxidoreductase [Silvibacterium sp.]|uniref:SDR family NAD(P)-dependent oxidoreductase n=1 Tax=Silvibacterium sp. TaxID=1964179 RepID=UPI0039E5AC6E